MVLPLKPDSVWDTGRLLTKTTAGQGENTETDQNRSYLSRCLRWCAQDNTPTEPSGARIPERHGATQETFVPREVWSTFKVAGRSQSQ